MVKLTGIGASREISKAMKMNAREEERWNKLLDKISEGRGTKADLKRLQAIQERGKECQREKEKCEEQKKKLARTISGLRCSGFSAVCKPQKKRKRNPTEEESDLESFFSESCPEYELEGVDPFLETIEEEHAGQVDESAPGCSAAASSSKSMGIVPGLVPH
ncbi:unnamed protein product, partial [Amoebophrya sp. A25]|eukprot:GSA25T00027840001.1